MISSSHFIESNHLLTGNQLPPRFGGGGGARGMAQDGPKLGEGKRGERKPRRVKMHSCSLLIENLKEAHPLGNYLLNN